LDQHITEAQHVLILFPSIPFASIPNSVVVARATRLGVSLGKSPSQMNASVELIKDLDLQRTLVMFKK
jgi:hypothetical protein